MEQHKVKLGDRIIFDKWVNGRLEGRYVGTVKGENHGVFRIEADNGVRPDASSAYFYLTASQFDTLSPLDEFVEGVYSGEKP